MKNKEKIDGIIVDFLRNGPFSTSDIEEKSDFSRSSIEKILRKLGDENILKKTAQRGAGVKYKLAMTEKALLFLFDSVEKLEIEDFAHAWGVQKNSAKQYIKPFVEDGTIAKMGSPPKKIIYIAGKSTDENFFSDEQKNTLTKYYCYTTPDGQILKGINGFLYWAKNKSNRADFFQLAQEYLETRKQYYGEKKMLYIDASEKLTYIFDDMVFMEKLFHKDFDALPVFGKTALSQKIRIAKSGQKNIVLMTEILHSIQEGVDEILLKYNIEAVGFIPPTVARKTQFMTFLSRKLYTNLPHIRIYKRNSLVPIQQKSLKKIEDRILNAKNTILVESDKKYKNILLIDDVTGSGSTLNETAKKIIDQDISTHVYGFTITGSAKAGVFDVISEA